MMLGMKPAYLALEVRARHKPGNPTEQAAKSVHAEPLFGGPIYVVLAQATIGRLGVSAADWDDGDASDQINRSWLVHASVTNLSEKPSRVVAQTFRGGSLIFPSVMALHDDGASGCS